MRHKVRYGVDAPHVVRYLFFFALLALGFVLVSFQIKQILWFWILLLYSSSMALTLFITASWMLYSSWVLKPRILSQITEKLQLKGNEHILDVGCGRGIFTIKVAKKLSQGKVFGIDLWFAKDQSGNRIENTLENAKAEEVDKYLELVTGGYAQSPLSR